MQRLIDSWTEPIGNFFYFHLGDTVGNSYGFCRRQYVDTIESSRKIFRLALRARVPRRTGSNPSIRQLRDTSMNSSRDSSNDTKEGSGFSPGSAAIGREKLAALESELQQLRQQIMMIQQVQAQSSSSMVHLHLPMEDVGETPRRSSPWRSEILTPASVPPSVGAPTGAPPPPPPPLPKSASAASAPQSLPPSRHQRVQEKELEKAKATEKETEPLSRASSSDTPSSSISIDDLRQRAKMLRHVSPPSGVKASQARLQRQQSQPSRDPFVQALTHKFRSASAHSSRRDSMSPVAATTGAAADKDTDTLKGSRALHRLSSGSWTSENEENCY
jgi:hypothetical protein